MTRYAVSIWHTGTWVEVETFTDIKKAIDRRRRWGQAYRTRLDEQTDTETRWLGESEQRRRYGEAPS